jgi:hypothetical protein
LFMKIGEQYPEEVLTRDLAINGEGEGSHEP